MLWLFYFPLLIFMFLNIVSWNARGLLNMDKFEKDGFFMQRSGCDRTTRNKLEK